jgi:hypothetical protein
LYLPRNFGVVGLVQVDEDRGRIHLILIPLLFLQHSDAQRTLQLTIEVDLEIVATRLQHYVRIDHRPTQRKVHLLLCIDLVNLDFLGCVLDRFDELDVLLAIVLDHISQLVNVVHYFICLEVEV